MALIMIPARMDSTRLPDKPMAMIAGKPMIQRVWELAQEAALGPVVVAAADQAIVDLIEGLGGTAILTDPDLPSGSDRIEQALQVFDPDRQHQVIVNLQGDLPTLTPEALKAVVECLDRGQADVATLAARILDPAERQDPNVVKVIAGFREQQGDAPALAFTRATAPSGRGDLYHHIGIYAYKRQALEAFVKLKPSPLETREKLEQMRLLENGMTMSVHLIDAVPNGVDTPADLTQAQRFFLSKKSNGGQGKISFQGHLGAYSHLACQSMFPDMEAVPAKTFNDALQLIQEGQVELGMIPIENSTAGRVADIHHLLPESGLYIIGEHFQPVIHHLLVKPGTRLDQVKTLYCHTHTIGQIRNFVRDHGLETEVHDDNAGAAQWISKQNDPAKAAVASSLAGSLYKLEALNKNINDQDQNTTRFVVLSRQEQFVPTPCDKPQITSMMVETKSVPAALYKVLGGFATNGINITKLESYVSDANFRVAKFFIEVEGHRHDPDLSRALDEIRHFAQLELLGTFAASAYRRR